MVTDVDTASDDAVLTSLGDLSWLLNTGGNDVAASATIVCKAIATLIDVLVECNEKSLADELERNAPILLSLIIVVEVPAESVAA